MVDVAGLSVRFGEVGAVRGVDLRVRPGECLALVGESGSGKSTVARALLGLAGAGAGVTARRLEVAGRDTRGFTDRDWRAVRGRHAALVAQDALVSLDPLRTLRAEIAEPMRVHGTVARERIAERVVELLAAVGVPEPAARAAQYPHQLSGGLRQRALIASALAADPRLLIADEPTTALDVTVQEQILGLFRTAKQSGKGILLISHDLAVVARIADRTAVLRAGEIVEEGPTARLIRRPRHPYTRRLLASVPAPRTASAAPEAAVVLAAGGLRKSYGGRLAVDGVALELRAGEALGLVGGSGSGKTTVARLALGLLLPDEGEVRLDGAPWSALSEKRRRARRHRIQLVPQDPYGSLDPRWTVRRLVAEALPRGAERPARIGELLGLVGLSGDHLDRRAHQLSGGQRQRVAIARALAPGPAVLVCDEPVSALDVSVQAQILDLLDGLRTRLGLALLFISHDLAVVRHVSDRVAVMCQGRIVEENTAAELFAHPRHPYTRELLAASPALVRGEAASGAQRRSGRRR
nr:ABC transporter ATP-binding protein [Streptomyces sp. TS71-3]